MDGSRRVKLSNENAWLSRIASPLTAAMAAGVSFIVVSRLVAVTTISSTTDSCAFATVTSAVAASATAWPIRTATRPPSRLVLTLMQAPQSYVAPWAPRIPTTHNLSALQLAYHHSNR